jgi:CheY-like chemotaxis protein
MRTNSHLSPAARPVALPGQPDPTSTRKPTVLLLEGDPYASAILWMLLDRFNFEVISETSGPAGRELARNLRLDAVVLDVDLPVMNGLEICRQLKADPETRALPVIFCSGQRYLADEAMEVGAAAFLSKPNDVLKLPGCLRQIIAAGPAHPFKT